MKQVTILKGVSLKATGKTQKFNPPVSLLDATVWYTYHTFTPHSLLIAFLFCSQNLFSFHRLVRQEGQGIFQLDFTFLFENYNGLIFEKGKYSEFDQMECILLPFISNRYLFYI